MEDLTFSLHFIPYALAIIALIIIVIHIMRDSRLVKFFMESASDETGRASGKSLTAFAFSFCLVVGWFVSIDSSPDHTAPEYYFWGLVSLICSLYGIKEVGRVVSIKSAAAVQDAACFEPETAEQLIEKLKTRYTESKSEKSFEEWIGDQASSG